MFVLYTQDKVIRVITPASEPMDDLIITIKLAS